MIFFNVLVHTSVAFERETNHKHALFSYERATLEPVATRDMLLPMKD